jgi:hypothetical protein
MDVVSYGLSNPTVILLDVVARALGLEDDLRVPYWYRSWDAAEPLLAQGSARRGTG